MTVSIIIPACDAEATLPRALKSLFRQTEPDWQAIIVSDDQRDYAAFLSGLVISDPRLSFASTGHYRSGCHHARNVSFEFVSGDYVTQLDADDEFTPTRLAELLPLAQRYGAAADNLLMIDELTEAKIATVMGEMKEVRHLDLQNFMTLNAPLVPLIRRDHVLPRVKGVEFSEDVIANIQLIDRIGALPVTPSSSYIYRINTQSMANKEGAAEKFERGYSEYIERLDKGDGFGLKTENRVIAREGLVKKRALNREYAEAVTKNPKLTFSEFVEEKR
ncbi:MAG: glycosyltransferase family 2 protein [Alphaproteobacteria bacterium]|nr:glycosyltransferase family 2 protein [Alphaproteobacteria bacterium]